METSAFRMEIKLVKSSGASECCTCIVSTCRVHFIKSRQLLQIHRNFFVAAFCYRRRENQRCGCGWICPIDIPNMCVNSIVLSQGICGGDGFVVDFVGDRRSRDKLCTWRCVRAEKIESELKAKFTVTTPKWNEENYRSFVYWYS